MYRLHHGVEHVFETYQLSDRFLQRCRDDFVRRALGDDASGVEDNHALAQGKNFFAAVRDIKDGDAVSLVPLAQIVDDRCLRRSVERGQRFIEKQHGGIGHQGSRQCRALALSAGNFSRVARCKMRDSKCLENRGRLRCALRLRQMRQAILDVLLHC